MTLVFGRDNRAEAIVFLSTLKVSAAAKGALVRDWRANGYLTDAEAKDVALATGATHWQADEAGAVA